MFRRMVFVFPNHRWMTDPCIPGDDWTPDSPEWIPCLHVAFALPVEWSKGSKRLWGTELPDGVKSPQYKTGLTQQRDGGKHIGLSQALPGDLRGPEAMWEFKSRSLTSWKACPVLFSMQSLRHQVCSEPASWLKHHKQGMSVAGRKRLICSSLQPGDAWSRVRCQWKWRCCGGFRHLQDWTKLKMVSLEISRIWLSNWNTWGRAQVFMVNLAFTKPKS